MKMRDSSLNMQQAWFVRGYKNGDEDGILQFIQLAFKWDDKKYWNWRYRDNPAGIGRIWLADDAGKIVGHYAMIPIKMKIGDETVTASLTVDIVTHPNYRRQGIFETLARKAYTEAGKEGGHILCAFPNEVAISLTTHQKQVSRSPLPNAPFERVDNITFTFYHPQTFSLY